MATQTSLVAQQVRLQQWAEQIRDCQSRPKGMDVETWCAQNNLTKANYYYRLRRVREVCLEQVQGTAATAFVELPVSTTASAELPKIPQTVTSDDTVPLIRIKNTKGLSADIFSGVSPEMLRHLIGALVMLNDADAYGFKKVYLAMGFTDLRRGIDDLATIVRFQFKLDPYDKNTLFLFCGRRSDRIKALLWEGDGFLLMYKRLDNGAFRWPRSADEAMSITKDQYRMLMQGLEIVARYPIEELKETPSIT